MMRAFGLIVTLSLAACQTSDLAPSASDALNAQRNHPGAVYDDLPGPNCYGVPYAEEKPKFDIVRQARQEDFEQIDADGKEVDNQRWGSLVISLKPLGFPVEISRIRRGFVGVRQGMSVNDGLSSWSGVDLDRKEVVFINRYTYAPQAAFSRPFGDPVLPSEQPEIHAGKRIYTRKWFDGDRVEMEIIQRALLSNGEIKAFICLANSALERVPLRKEKQYAVLTPDHAQYDVILRDLRISGERMLRYEKYFDPGVLDEFVGAMRIKIQKYEWIRK
ncbi:hypothetical protein [Azospirillum sp. TSO22-1]|uniref:hypothetical protein n=1 Tax=Azospirillum sp. TSO22-1 TaxID=716789 RepID=UPI0011B75096|nr:hypothetical protein [Azospirillum sp. TSO22-1]